MLFYHIFKTTFIFWMLLPCTTMINNIESKQEENKKKVRHRFSVVRQFAYVHRSEYNYIQLINQFGLQYIIFIVKPYYPQNTPVTLAVNWVSLDAGIRAWPFAATEFLYALGKSRPLGCPIRTVMLTQSPCGLRLLKSAGVRTLPQSHSDGHPLATLLVLSNFFLCLREYKLLVPTLKNHTYHIIIPKSQYSLKTIRQRTKIRLCTKLQNN